MDLIAINLGNSRTSFGFFHGRDLVRVVSIRTPRTPEWRLERQLVEVLGLEGRECTLAVASTVPRLTPSLVDELKRVSGKDTFVIEYTEALGIRTCYGEPGTLGVDRLMNAAYVKSVVRLDSVVVDVGTAITVDAVSALGQMMGGAILPGPLASMYGLAQTAAQLAEVDLKPPDGALGCSTEECIRAGILVGLEGAVKHLVQAMVRELGWEDPKLLFTGGGSGVFRRAFPGAEFDENLTLKGIYEAMMTLRPAG